ncbi:polysaccharide deacetylase family protein [Flavobacterium sp. H122]|uniref:polysaccharide deacetylase family protein n=1 Tax=Flavobacterium sp. H122 TaxID=2529860 RepID=UPI0010AABDE4|nr:polysaccharide deacetylase family protein [Flavobacterium sp. H122]
MLKHKNSIVLCLILFFALIVFNAGWGYFVLLFLFFLGMTSWGSFDIRLEYFVKTFNSNPLEKNKRIALTFDDGPHEMTIEVLDLLKKYNAKATFFCIGTQIEKYPEILKRILAEGHLVGNHTYTHSKSIGFFSTEKVIEEIKKTNTILAQFTNQDNLLFRPPFGVTNPNIAKAVSVLNQKVIGWNVRSLDTVIQEEDKILNRIIKGTAPGAIVLMHDTSIKTVHVLEQLLLFLHSESYEMVTVDQLLNIAAYEN